VWENESYLIIVKVVGGESGGVCIDKMTMRQVCIECKLREVFPGSYWCEECVLSPEGGSQ
jgi:hypothetical protein